MGKKTIPQLFSSTKPESAYDPIIYTNFVNDLFDPMHCIGKKYTVFINKGPAILLIVHVFLYQLHPLLCPFIHHTCPLSIATCECCHPCYRFKQNLLNLLPLRSRRHDNVMLTKFADTNKLLKNWRPLKPLGKIL